MAEIQSTVSDDEIAALLSGIIPTDDTPPDDVIETFKTRGVTTYSHRSCLEIICLSACIRALTVHLLLHFCATFVPFLFGNQILPDPDTFPVLENLHKRKGNHVGTEERFAFHFFRSSKSAQEAAHRSNETNMASVWEESCAEELVDGGGCPESG
ncbi:uncharacterized protein LOC120295857 [Eucalyptus grandis]|uniref:uncharacterized protein LOC120295857 n=1 Tax=Eucalyptus grandis TaxID=71139 RepID=UPI00192EC49B|nr:uncharacterized protein LOC120295857 [Eucalyptus grandis]